MNNHKQKVQIDNATQSEQGRSVCPAAIKTLSTETHGDHPVTITTHI